MSDDERKEFFEKMQKDREEASAKRADVGQALDAWVYAAL